MALATVVKVIGSSYRRPGARMLVTDDGNLTGAISGGCLEGDARRKALMAIQSGQNKLVTYDTTDEDDARLGVQLGCNGIVHILFEPFTSAHHTVLELLEQIPAARKEAVLATFFSFEQQAQPGTRLLLQDDQLLGNVNLDVFKLVDNDLKKCLREKRSEFYRYGEASTVQEVFLDYMPPTLRVVIAGGGNDAIPLCNMMSIIGWETIIVDGRPAQVTADRFPKADALIVAKAENVLEQVEVDKRTVFILLTHNYNYDQELLARLPATDTRYIGVLGPKSKLERMIRELEDRGVNFSNEERSKIYGPVGLDVGAETAEEIAISIVAEIQSVFANRSGTPLRKKKDPIHSQNHP